MQHLHPSVLGLMELSEKERIASLFHERWVGYPGAKGALEKMEELFGMPPKSRMPNLLILAHTNNGKTHIIERFLRRHPSSDEITEDSVLLPIAFVQAPPQADESAFYTAILDNFAAPVRSRDPAGAKLRQLINLMKLARTKMLIIDEIQHLLAGDQKRHRVMLNAIKYIGNELKIPIVAAGTEVALNAVQIDPQISNRFQPVPLPRWKADENWNRLLSSFEKLIPLANPSSLASEKISMRLWQMSEGLIGEVSDLLNKAARSAILGGGERIELPILDSVDWTPPSARRRRAEELL